MKKKVICGFLTLMMATGVLAGCGGSGSGSGSGSNAAGGDTAADVGGEVTEAGTESAEKDFSGDGKVINIYVWNQEFITRFDNIYPEVATPSKENDGTVTVLKDGTEVHWIVNPNQDGVYQQKLDEALTNQASASDDDKIDLFLSETDYVAKYTDADADVAIPLTDLGIDPATDLADQYPASKEAASDANGVQRASTWQSCPGLLIYRRDIAKDVFGTDDPKEIGEKVKDWATVKSTAEELKSKGYHMFSSYADTFRLYGNAISDQWVKDGVLTVDPQIMDWINVSKEWEDAGYFDSTVKGQWNDDWNKSMSSESKVFAFLGPAWFLDFTLKPNWDGEDGSWGVTNPPVLFNWGGSYIQACTGTDNPKYAKDIILEMTGNKDNLLKISKDYMDYTNTVSGMKELASDPATAASFLGGQNAYELYAPSAEQLKMAPLSYYDQGCVECIQNAFGDYFQGQIDFDTAKTNFEKAIKERYPDITEVVWPAAE